MTIGEYPLNVLDLQREIRENTAHKVKSPLKKSILAFEQKKPRIFDS